MKCRLILFFFISIIGFIPGLLWAQDVCPYSISFPDGNLSHWEAYTGNNKSGNGPTAIQLYYDSTVASPTGTIGATNINEYNFPATGIQVNSTNSVDQFGGFATIPTINGYYYGHSIKLGSTNITTNGISPDLKGGYIRGISYSIKVPAGSVTVPFTLTYAYAMVLENGSHNSNEQPLLQANLTTQSGINISCASYSYYLPTFNNAGNGGSATLDVATAIKQGFSLSNVLSPNNNGNLNESKHRVWTKGWTEVTFDLAPYRGQQVYLTFEADNCVPGGHFAYAYIALKNNCGGLMISGNSVACTNSIATYSIPTLANAKYSWTVPAGWQILNNSDTTNILIVKVGSSPGIITANEVNSCANLSSTFNVNTSIPTLAGNVVGNNTVCIGTNASTLTLNGIRGNVIKWLSSTDGNSWTDIGNSGSINYAATNLNQTTFFKAIIQNGSQCSADTSNSAAIIHVDSKSVAGSISPLDAVVCNGQGVGANFTLSGTTGNVLNWQTSSDGINWKNVSPTYTGTVFNVIGTVIPLHYRTIVKNGVCPSDTSNTAVTSFNPTNFPKAVISPADTTICNGTSVSLNTTINIGSEYKWMKFDGLTGDSGQIVNSTPYSFSKMASPSQNTSYIISIINAGCPNVLVDTFFVKVLPEIVLNVSNDTSIVLNQPLQLFANVQNVSEIYSFTWTPSTNLNDPTVYDPIAIFTTETNPFYYKVKVTDGNGCYVEDSIKIKVFNTNPDIFVPSAFTPNGDGLNDILRPIPVGISSLDFFRVFNRFGQMVFSTSMIGYGWDGTIKGVPQASGTFVYVTQGKDYQGNVIYRKGTTVLIR